MADVMFTGPLPKVEWWCAICAGIAKQAVLAARKDTIEQAAKTAGPAVWLPVPDTLGESCYAVTMSVSLQFPQLGPVPLCWSHLAGIDTDPSHARRQFLIGGDGAGLPPGLLGGPRG